MLMVQEWLQMYTITIWLCYDNAELSSGRRKNKHSGAYLLRPITVQQLQLRMSQNSSTYLQYVLWILVRIFIRRSHWPWIQFRMPVWFIVQLLIISTFAFIVVVSMSTSGSACALGSDDLMHAPANKQSYTYFYVWQKYSFTESIYH